MMKKLLVVLIQFYKNYISPSLPACCRFYPTCSSYALQAVSEYGAIRGGFLSVKRILRCHPFCKGGYDPVPGPEAVYRRRKRSAGDACADREKDGGY